MTTQSETPACPVHDNSETPTCPCSAWQLSQRLQHVQYMKTQSDSNMSSTWQLRNSKVSSTWQLVSETQTCPVHDNSETPTCPVHDNSVRDSNVSSTWQLNQDFNVSSTRKLNHRIQHVQYMTTQRLQRVQYMTTQSQTLACPVHDNSEAPTCPVHCNSIRLQHVQCMQNEGNLSHCQPYSREACAVQILILNSCAKPACFPLNV